MFKSKMIVLIFGVMLLIYGIHGTSYGNPDDLEIEADCEVVEHLVDDLFRVRIWGTVTARKDLQFLTIKGYIDGEWLGADIVGDLSAGSAKDFSITGLYTHDGGDTPCSVEYDYIVSGVPNDPPDANQFPDDEPSDGTTYSSGEDIPTLPTGSWFPETVSGARVVISGGTTIVTFGNGGSIIDDGITYTCVAAGGCTVEGRRVTQGTIQTSGGGQPLPPAPKPDLAVEQPTVSKSTLTPGERFTLSATVTNEGAGSASATTLRYYRSINATISTSDTEAGTDRVSALGANERSTESINLTAPASAGTYYYGACVEAVTDESRSDNNCSAAVSITVQQSTQPAGQTTYSSGEDIPTLPTGSWFPETVSGSGGGARVVISGGTTIVTFGNGGSIIDDGITYTCVAAGGCTVEGRRVTQGTIQTNGGSELTAHVSVTAVKAIEFNLSVPAGLSLIHVPLKVTEVDGAAKTIESIGNLYDALGGASYVNFLITYDSQTQEWRTYFDTSDAGTPADRELTDDMGVIAGMIRGKDIRLSGEALGTNGSSTITLALGLNLVGLPLHDSRITRVSDLFSLDGIGGNIPVIILTDGGEAKAVGRAGDPGDIEITGGQAFIMIAQRAATVAISGEGWTNAPAAAVPSVAMRGVEVNNVTPILALRGSIVDEGGGLHNTSFRVIAKNRSTGRSVATVTGREYFSHSGMWGSQGIGYRLTDVDLETARAARIGDVLEISAQSSQPLIGVEPLQYTVTAEDVRQGWIQLPSLVAHEIPAETQLLRNYPNPFNPETWIPYHLANDGEVSLSIYDINGALVRELDLGHQRAGYYTDRSRAAYWDGRNGFGERVASGVYFYQLRADDYSQMRKMVIVK